MNLVRLIVLCAALLAAPLPAASPLSGIERIEQDIALAAALERLKRRGRTGDILIRNVSVVDPVAGRAIPDQSVIVRTGRIAWVGATSSAPARWRGAVIDGGGRFLSPGLADMHVHTSDMGEHLLRLAAGVTTVRDMAGFPWMLRMRDAIAAGRMVGATPHVSGTIIADYPLEGFAQVVRSGEEARAAVRDQAACGYSFIKVHNRLAQPLFDEVAAEARRLGLDLVGHVPHDIALRHAIHSGGIRTIEHLKGFLRDQTLLPSEEDFATAMAGARLWITPTLYTRLDRSYGTETTRLIADPRARFVPRTRREAWRETAVRPGSGEAELYDRLVGTQREVIRRLLPLRPRWLAGTDAAYYRFNIAGFALHDELTLMHELGIAAVEVVRAATSEAAAALRGEREFGRIEPGLRADFVLLAGNPLQDISAYRAPLAVMARGRWYDRAALDEALAELARIYDRAAPRAIARSQARRLASGIEAWTRRGYVFAADSLVTAARELEAAGMAAEAARLVAAADVPRDGPCAAELPQ